MATVLARLKRRAFDALLWSMRRRAGLRLESATIADGNIAYLDNGERAGVNAQTLVMIHGLGADKDTWLPVSRYLAPHFRLLIPDLAGHGGSVQNASLNFGFDAQTSRILEFLESLEVERAHVIGSSMGGAVAAHLARKRPETVMSLGLISSYGLRVRPSYVDELAEREGFNPMLEIFDRSDYKRMTSLAMFDPPFIPGFMLDVLVDDMMARRDINRKIHDHVAVDHDLASVLNEVRLPSLLIWGADDKVLHVENAAVFRAALQNCTSVILDETGHVPMVERPEITAQHIRSFVMHRDACRATGVQVTG